MSNRVNWSDASGTITTGGTAQTVLAASDSAGRRFLMIQNAGTDSLWYNFGLAAVVGQPSVEIEAGAAAAVFDEKTGIIPQDYLSIIGRTAGQAFTVKYVQ